MSVVSKNVSSGLRPDANFHKVLVFANRCSFPKMEYLEMHLYTNISMHHLCVPATSDRYLICDCECFICDLEKISDVLEKGN